jgi:diguanylate cyclase (GGDEF)-like protein/PAS domain S-box-containing protein
MSRDGSGKVGVVLNTPPAHAGGQSPVGHAAPALLYRSDRTSVSRVPLPGGEGGATAIRKEAHGGDAVERMRHETTVLRRLTGVPGVPELLDVSAEGTSILLADSLGSALSESVPAAGTDPLWVTRFGLSLAHVVASMHRRGVIHKDINPSNVLVRGDDSEATLVDFDLATTFAEERPEFTHHHEVAGSLPYLAPEQTGRTGWPVDHRADLYALGATLYELLTGRPPFGDDTAEPLRLIHAHLARSPEPPSTLNPAVPPTLSAVVLRLLEKEPDQRYQSADGLAHDLARLALGRDEAARADFRLGNRDFPLRLTAPSRPVGRAAERAALVAAYQGIRRGGARGFLLTGAPGVGKSALLDELRPLVTEHGGWLVTGKFDQYRQDIGADALPQAFMALGRLLLAEPEDRLAEHRERLLAGLGTNAGVVAAWPEFATLLGVRHELPEGDPAEVRSRIYRSCIDVLAAVATQERPVVMVLDDLQWAGDFPIGAIDALLTDGDLSGLLVVGAFRGGEVDAAHPLAAMIERWQRLGVAPQQLSLENLPPSGLATLLAEMLRLDGVEAARLAEAVGARTAGNPFDTVELVNALRREGALVSDDAGWRWDADTIRRFVGASDVLDLLAARIERLPADTGRLLQIMACLSGDIDSGLLAAAAGLTEDQIRERLAPALEDGLLVAVASSGTPRPPGPGESQAGRTAARFRHDRVQQAAHDHLSAEARDELRLTLARRLAGSRRWAAMAGEQYLHAAAAVSDPAEARRAAGLFLAAGTRLKLINAPTAERYLSAASALLLAVGEPADDPLLADVRSCLHEVLHTLGRLGDADEVYRAIAERCDDPVDLVGPAGLQISSLVSRARSQDALTLGMGLLADLGVALPAPEELGVEITRGLAELHAWVERAELDEDLTRPQIGDPRWVAVAEVINRVMAAAYFCDPVAMAWLVLRARRIWAELGPCPHLVGPIAHAGILTIGVEGDYRTGYEAVRRMVSVGEARGYEPMTSQARFLLTVGSQPWFEPLEEVAAQAELARAGCIRAGDVYHAAYTYVTAQPFMFDLLPSLDRFLDHVEAGVAFALRTGSTSVLDSLRHLRQFARAMRGETTAPGSFTDADFDEDRFLAEKAGIPVGMAHYHTQLAVAALIFRDGPTLQRHAPAAVALVDRVPGAYCAALAHLAHAMAMALRLREPGVGDHFGLLGELDVSRDWLAERARDAPANFGHLSRLVEAERAWATGDLWTAAAAFDAAMSDVQRLSRPWHRALITERAALFHLERGLHLAGNRLLAEAWRYYAEWGAAGKVRRLEEEHPSLLEDAPAVERLGAGSVRTGARSVSGHTKDTAAESIDLPGVLRAAQAMASETNLDRLRGRVVEVLTMMTGATSVQLAQWKDDSGGWFVPDEHVADEHVAGEPGVHQPGPAGPDGPGRLITVDEAARRALLPISAFRYAERTGEPLRVDDATRDDRFARDPYLAGLERCSLLVVPIQSHGRSRAMLLLENRLSRGAFSADRLDAVMLVAGQLAVCLDNALAERFRSLVQRSSELTLVCDRSGTLSYASSAAVELLGVEATALAGRSVGDVIAASDREVLLGWVARTGAAAGLTSEANETLTCRLEPRDGEERWAEVTLTDLSADPAVSGLMLRLRDVTERRRLERALEELATTDPLTGMANRRRFDETLRAEAERCLRAGSPLTLLLLDIDHFKAVNDTYGHPAGDAVLKAVAAQCRAAVRDIDLVARVGGEEFAVLLVEADPVEGEQVADRMRRLVAATHVPIPGHPPLTCTVSLGVAAFTSDPTDLMTRADAALYRAKAEGRNRVCIST